MTVQNLVLNDGLSIFQHPGASSTQLDLAVALRATQLPWSVESVPVVSGPIHFPICGTVALSNPINFGA